GTSISRAVPPEGGVVPRRAALGGRSGGRRRGWGRSWRRGRGRGRTAHFDQTLHVGGVNRADVIVGARLRELDLPGRASRKRAVGEAPGVFVQTRHVVMSHA